MGREIERERESGSENENEREKITKSSDVSVVEYDSTGVKK